MICQNCQKEISNDVKFCKFCGKEISDTDHPEVGSVDMYFKKRDNSCQVCGTYAPVKYVEFHQNIGMLFRREHRYIKGNLCKNCINQTFWKFTLITLAVGWIGTISLIVAPFFILNNIFRYIMSLGLPKDIK